MLVQLRKSARPCQTRSRYKASVRHYAADLQARNNCKVRNVP